MRPVNGGTARSNFPGSIRRKPTVAVRRDSRHRGHDCGPEGHHVFNEEGGEVGGSGYVGAAGGEASFGGVEEAVEIY